MQDMKVELNDTIEISDLEYSIGVACEAEAGRATTNLGVGMTFTYRAPESV